MTFELFIISLVLLIILFGIKVSEQRSNKRIISQNLLRKSDIVLVHFFRYLFVHYNKFVLKLSELPNLSERTKEKMKDSLIRQKDKIATKAIRALNVNNIKDIEKNKGSVSLFLKSISDDKKDKK